MSDHMLDAADRYIDDVQNGEMQAHILAMAEAASMTNDARELRAALTGADPT